MKSSVDGLKEVVSMTKPVPTITLVEPRFVNEDGPVILRLSETERSLSEGLNVPAVAHRTVTLTLVLIAPEVEEGAKRQSPAVPEYVKSPESRPVNALLNFTEKVNGDNSVLVNDEVPICEIRDIGTAGRLSPIWLSLTPRVMKSSSPSCPSWFFPQHVRRPSSRTAQV